MGIRHTQSFKIQAVEKALNRSSQASLQEIADNLGVGYSTLGKWISKSRNHELEYADSMMKPKEKRPQDWSLEERLNMVIACASLDEEKMNAYCREQGVYPIISNSGKKILPMVIHPQAKRNRKQK